MKTPGLPLDEVNAGVPAAALMSARYSRLLKKG